MSINIIKNVNIKPERKRCLSSGCANGSIKKNQGFTLLEAMIGFLVLSIGMLGIASLQGISLKAGKTSVYGSVAMMKAEELLESMRVNSTVLGDYADAGGGTACSTATCSPEELAQDDLFWWNENLKAGLPADPEVVITVTPPAAKSKMATVTVGISWDERNKDKGGDSSVTRSFSTTSSICTGVPC